MRRDNVDSMLIWPGVPAGFRNGEDLKSVFEP